MNPFKENTWALDVSHYPGPLAWVPVNLKSGEVAGNLVIVSDRPPNNGKPVALWSLQGEEHTERIAAEYEAELRVLFKEVQE